jgi:hypothetical protein
MRKRSLDEDPWGMLSVRVRESLRKAIVRAAAAEGKQVSTWVRDILQERIDFGPWREVTYPGRAEQEAVE